MFGNWTGAFCHVVFAASGLTAILAASTYAFTIIKWMGVAYLLWLGVRALCTKGNSFEIPETQRRHSLRSVYLQGVFVDLFNPKVSLFFLAFLPQFVVAEKGSIWLQLLVHGGLVIAVAALIEPPLVLVANRVTKQLRSNRRLAIWLDRTLGMLFVALAARLSMMER